MAEELGAGQVPTQQRDGEMASWINHHHGRIPVLALQQGGDQPGDGSAGSNRHEGRTAVPVLGQERRDRRCRRHKLNQFRLVQSVEHRSTGGTETQAPTGAIDHEATVASKGSLPSSRSGWWGSGSRTGSG